MRAIFVGIYLVTSLLSATSTYAQEKGKDKVQEMIARLKELYRYREQGEEYITDGERIFWVKYYKTWTPKDLVTLKKENLSALIFLRTACQANRADVLEQLLPDHYSSQGGVKAFSEDIIRIAPSPKAEPASYRK